MKKAIILYMVFINISFCQGPPDSVKKFFSDINKIKTTFYDDGSFGGVRGLDSSSYDGHSFLSSGGFYLSGYLDDSLWVNGEAPSNRVFDYLPGKVGMSKDDPKNDLFVVKSSDIPFGDSWQNWKNAVDLGADFYDGNNDGIYNPVDLNNNGKWDQNEDKPALIGDITIWTVYNDDCPKSLRLFNNYNPLGIEVQQTVFAYKGFQNDALQNSFFIKYKIINKSNTALLDSVYFGLFADPDIGNNYSFNKIATDSELKASYAYNIGTDPGYGVNPPSLLLSILEGPIEYIKDKTYIDVNNDNQFTEGIDTPLDTAFNKAGYISPKSFKGAMNVEPSSAMGIFRYLWPFDPPNVGDDVRHYLVGHDQVGREFNPCDTMYSIIKGNFDCKEIKDKNYLFNGDPVKDEGWLMPVNLDVYLLVNIGPFTLKKDEPKTILGAYVAGRGFDNLNSISVAKENFKDILGLYNSEVLNFVTDAKEKDNTVYTYSLSQNYPNPFNPSTTIKYSIPKENRVKINIYNACGQLIKTLVDEVKLQGEYTVTYNANNMSSGVYFYTITSGNFHLTKKMILLK